MSKIWVTSDTHFGSDRVRELSKRPFNTVEEMDSEMIRRWNEVVGENDEVIHLGDFGDYHRVKELNGKVTLVNGNYESKQMKDEQLSSDGFTNWLKEIGFEHVSCLGIFFLNGYDGTKLKCIHKPSKRSNGVFNLFGHIHGLQMVKHNGLNVGVDCHNFYPIDLDTVFFYKNCIENVYDEEVFME